MPPADAIVLLGCTVSRCGLPSAALERRIDLAVRAFDAGLAPLVVASGGRRWGEHVEAAVMKRELLARGVPAASIVMELFSLSTIENCWFTRELLGPERSRVLVATCAWHMRRALLDFRRVGITATAPPDGWLTTPSPTLARRVRENVNMFLDWCMMPRVHHG